jgi:clan AA aspartic protease
MLTGIVTAGLQPKTDLDLFGSSGGSQRVEAVIDTGFDGELILPRALVTALGLNRRGTYGGVLADGRRVVLDYYEVSILWHGRPRMVTVLQSHAVALLGMELLQGSRFTMDTCPGGAVTIEELP